jgi:RNA polymerase sigma-70 factor (ECF subfamily)
MQNRREDVLTEEDERLVERAQGRDHAAFAELIRRHRPACMKLAVSMLRDYADAEEEMQRAVLKAYQHLGQFQRDARFSTWLTRILVNQCLMRIRRGKRARFLYLDEGAAHEDISTLELRSNETTPEQEVARREISRVMQKEIGRIPPLLRTVFLLREVHELPIAIVAEQLGISVAAAKSRLLRARAELRDRLQKHCGRLGPATLMAEA